KALTPSRARLNFSAKPSACEENASAISRSPAERKTLAYHFTPGTTRCPLITRVRPQRIELRRRTPGHFVRNEQFVANYSLRTSGSLVLDKAILSPLERQRGVSS